MMKFLGLCVRASMYGVQNRRNYWREVAQFNPVDFKFSSVMTREHFERVLASLILPAADGSVDTSDQVDDATWDNVKAFAQACFNKWPGGLGSFSPSTKRWCNGRGPPRPTFRTSRANHTH